MDPLQDDYYPFDDYDTRQVNISPFWFWWMFPSPWIRPPRPWHQGPWQHRPPRPWNPGHRPPRW